MKSVLLSIQPKWCELIASEKKTVEIRKTRPKIEPPFKCYIYETMGKTETPFVDEDGHMDFHGRGQVIGEFICDVIFLIGVEYSDTKSKIASAEFPYTCLTDKQIMDYIGNGKVGYGWHISNLVIYDKPKELKEFRSSCDSKCNGICEYGCIRTIKRPPQSWCYVEEEVKNNA